MMKKLCCFFGFIFLGTTICQISLDQLALKHGTDKSSSWHNYMHVYEKYFEPYRLEPIRFLEIGFALGASARVWQDYFQNAELFFIDIQMQCQQIAKPILNNRSKLFILDQSNIAQLNSFITQTGGSFDIIIDDGGHKMDQQINSFKALFPALKGGGIYVIEDLHTSYWPNYGGVPGRGTCVEFLQKLVDDVNFIGATTGCADIDKCAASISNNLHTFKKDIKSIHFYCSTCVIIKK